eukprot:scaffold4416_cov228-Prasinococcus_capsulatus_cf.AAC.3
MAAATVPGAGEGAATASGSPPATETPSIPIGQEEEVGPDEEIEELGPEEEPEQAPSGPSGSQQ